MYLLQGHPCLRVFGNFMARSPIIIECITIGYFKLGSPNLKVRFIQPQFRFTTIGFPFGLIFYLQCFHFIFITQCTLLGLYMQVSEVSCGVVITVCIHILKLVLSLNIFLRFCFKVCTLVIKIRIKVARKRTVKFCF